MPVRLLWCWFFRSISCQISSFGCQVLRLFVHLSVFSGCSCWNLFKSIYWFVYSCITSVYCYSWTRRSHSMWSWNQLRRCFKRAEVRNGEDRLWTTTPVPSRQQRCCWIQIQPSLVVPFWWRVWAPDRIHSSNFGRNSHRVWSFAKPRLAPDFSSWSCRHRQLSTLVVCQHQWRDSWTPYPESSPHRKISNCSVASWSLCQARHVLGEALASSTIPRQFVLDSLASRISLVASFSFEVAKSYQEHFSWWCRSSRWWQFPSQYVEARSCRRNLPFWWQSCSQCQDQSLHQRHWTKPSRSSCSQTDSACLCVRHGDPRQGATSNVIIVICVFCIMCRVSWFFVFL